MIIKFGSARFDENGGIKNGKEGDQTGKEVSEQLYYLDKRGWYVLRAKDPVIAQGLCAAMRTACSNDNIGYNQYERAQVVKYGINTTRKVNADCSSLVRACCIACGFDPGNFYTKTQVQVLEKTGRFFTHFKLINKNDLYEGDILVTCTTGHTVIVTRGPKRESREYFPAYTGPDTFSIIDGLKYVKAKSTFQYRKKIAAANDIGDYKGSAAQNTYMLNLLKKGKLLKP